eukprot:3666351-Rhodomonas_salina.2
MENSRGMQEAGMLGGLRWEATCAAALQTPCARLVETAISTIDTRFVRYLEQARVVFHWDSGRRMWDLGYDPRGMSLAHLLLPGITIGHCTGTITVPGTAPSDPECWTSSDGHGKGTEEYWGLHSEC